ncbi:MAG: hypothetical protein A2W61_08565 [Deltaproteobacteria bacterium RIFCSPLOWO2_01_44_7]|nr:MAG: hypothetical protein A2712_09730 [Deltaproteobacteria bacterium RIFCSPHIGHO2_01_FULL_43_49]OGQ15392.1 MAG: hypothetical protein A3D22_10260 [Deltaproteobacteria bacterium RIFCSPHIGHO2_02_FULL_44_53]OGQ29586.1 MAG: hypothetical protein A3D98_10460 [Deltaproteobacteria bacterium RIFCSPHIGHO2_12_FULL_44_21]OGQ32199.1 MAG: hypothetical protein A2979_00105 [Deltaproteobacteria bacterium RIFCSPLOWO2_01_FULL_45_74]OGQ43840.1 MAG: hypothetical protein A3I70_04000 [Deltaproteobacteria bacterium 
MEQSKIRERLGLYKEAYQTFRDELHWWDDVQTKIDDEIEKIDQELVQKDVFIADEKLAQYAEKYQTLQKATQNEIQSNVDGYDPIITGLKVTAVAGIAIPLIYFTRGKILLWVGKSALRGGIAGGGLFAANGILGGGLNALGQLFTGKFDGEQFWEMATTQMELGGLLGGFGLASKAAGGLWPLAKKIFWGSNWRTRIPWLLVGTSSAAVLHASSQESAGSFINPQDLTLPYPDVRDVRYQQSTGDYIRLMRHFMQTNSEREAYGISPMEMDILAEHAKTSVNPEIQFVFTQMNYEAFNQLPNVRRASGEFVALYRKNAHQDNFCLNFTPDTQILPCDVGSHHFASTSSVKTQSVPMNFPIYFEDRGKHSEYAKEAMAFRINQQFLSADEGIDLIVKSIGSPSVVASLIPRIYQKLLLPDAVAAVNYILLNIFMSSREISADVKMQYADLLSMAIADHQKLFIERTKVLRQDLAVVDSAPLQDASGHLVLMSPFKDEERAKTFLERLHTEGELVKKALGIYLEWSKTHVAKEFQDALEKDIGRHQKYLTDVYSDFDEIQHNIFSKSKVPCEESIDPEKCPSRYLITAKETYTALTGVDKLRGTLTDGYVTRSRGIWDVWHSSNSFMEGAFGGWFVGSFGLKIGLTKEAGQVFREMPFIQKAWAYTPWILAGAVVYPNVSALLDAASEPVPLEMNFPEMTGYVPHSRLQLSEIKRENREK